MSDDVSAWLSGLSPWSAVLALLAVVVGWLLARAARRATTAMVGRLRGLSPTVTALTARIVFYAVVLLGFGVALTFLGAPVQPILAAAVVVGVIAVLALRGISDNFAAGVVLQTRRPIDVGDLITCDGHTGTVVDMNGRSVEVRTADGVMVHIPNSTVLATSFTNHSAGGLTRSRIEIRLDGQIPPHETSDVITQVLTSNPHVSAVDQTQILTVLDSPDRQIIRVGFWSNPHTAVNTTSQVLTALAAQLNRGGRRAVVTSILPPPPLTPPTEV